jgi:hypothetical protein
MARDCGNVMMEGLERRVCLAGDIAVVGGGSALERAAVAVTERLENWAPASVAGYQFDFKISSGTDPFSDRGSYLVVVAKTGNSYELFGDSYIDDSVGTYSYRRTGAAKAEVKQFDDYSVGQGSSRTLSFTSPTTGTFEWTGDEGGFQKGTFKATPPAPPVANGVLSGQVFIDANGNRKKDSKESVVGQSLVFLDANNNGVLDAGEKSKLTDRKGRFSFSKLPAGTYLVRHVPVKGTRLGTPRSGQFKVKLGIDQVVGGLDFADAKK